MKKLRSKMTIIVTLVFGLLWLAACHSRNPYHFYSPSKFRSPEKRVEWLKKEISDRLELDDTQKERLDEITGDFIERGKEMQAVRTSIRDTIISEFRKDQITKENLTQAFAENRAKIDDLIFTLADRLVEFHQILTPEQRAKLVAEIEKHEGRKGRYHLRW